MKLTMGEKCVETGFDVVPPQIYNGVSGDEGTTERASAETSDDNAAIGDGLVYP